MTAARTIAAYRAEFSANSAQYEADMRRAARATQSGTARMNRALATTDKAIGKGAASLGMMAKRAASLPAALAVLSGAGAGGLAGASRNALRFADSIAKASDTLGTGIEQLQEYRFAALRMGVAQRTTDMALQRFIRRTAEAAAGTGEARGALKEMGIELRDSSGRLRSTDDLLNQVADALRNVEDQGERVRLGFKLFDSEGVRFINVLQGGSAALMAMREEARNLGAVIDRETVRRFERANDQLDTMQQVIDVNLKVALAELAPLLVTIAEGLASIARGAANVASAFRGISAQTSDDLIEKIANLRQRVAGTRGTQRLGLQNQLTAALQELQQRTTGQQQRFAPFGAGAPQQTQAEVAAAQARGDRIFKIVEEGLKRREQLIAESLQIREDLERRAEETRLTRRMEVTDQLSQMDQAVEVSYEGLLARREAAERQAAETAMFWAANVGDAFALAFERATLGAEDFRTTIGDLANDLNRMLLRFGMQAIIGAGVSQVGQLAALENFSLNFGAGGMSGFRRGGSFQVGGRGGPDSQVVSFRATPGERVIVQTPDQQRRTRGKIPGFQSGGMLEAFGRASRIDVGREMTDRERDNIEELLDGFGLGPEQLFGMTPGEIATFAQNSASAAFTTGTTTSGRPSLQGRTLGRQMMTFTKQGIRAIMDQRARDSARAAARASAGAARDFFGRPGSPMGFFANDDLVAAGLARAAQRGPEFERAFVGAMGSQGGAAQGAGNLDFIGAINSLEARGAPFGRSPSTGRAYTSLIEAGAKQPGSVGTGSKMAQDQPPSFSGMFGSGESADTPGPGGVGGGDGFGGGGGSGGPTSGGGSGTGAGSVGENDPGFGGDAFQRGGSFLVPGSGGQDTQPVSFMATPGEMVSVTPAAAMRRNAGGGGDQIFIDARGADREGLAQLQRLLQQLSASVEPRAIRAVSEARKRNSNLFGGA